MSLLSIAVTAGWLITSALPLGGSVPDFTAPNQDGKPVTLSAFRGKPVLVYFYPKDDTPGCTKQACDLRDRHERFQRAGAVILGVSRQDAASHTAFRAKHRLPFDLLTDADGAIAKALGIETIPLLGVHKRQSLVVGPDGTLLAFFPDVDPGKHAEEVLAVLGRVKAAGEPARGPDAGQAKPSP